MFSWIKSIILLPFTLIQWVIYAIGRLFQFSIKASLSMLAILLVSLLFDIDLGTILSSIIGLVIIIYIIPSMLSGSKNITSSVLSGGKNVSSKVISRLRDLSKEELKSIVTTRRDGSKSLDRDKIRKKINIDDLSDEELLYLMDALINLIEEGKV